MGFGHSVHSYDQVQKRMPEKQKYSLRAYARFLHLALGHEWPPRGPAVPTGIYNDPRSQFSRLTRYTQVPPKGFRRAIGKGATWRPYDLNV
jgi:hypothetical protein